MRHRALVAIAVLVTVGGLVHLARAPEKPLADQPFPDAPEYADGARSLAEGDGYSTTVHGGERQPSRYPPGFSMALTPFATVGDFPGNVQNGAKLYAAFYLLAAVLAAWALGGPLPAALAGLFVWVSPFAHTYAGLVMSDAFVAGLAVLPLALVARPTRAGTRLAGAVSGMAALSRLTAGVQLVALLAALPRRHWVRALVWAVPFGVILLLTQWLVFDNPLRTGYEYWGVADNAFAADHLTADVANEGPFVVADRLDGDLMDFTCPCPVGGSQADFPNVSFYPLVLAGGWWVFAPPLVQLIGLGYAIRRWRDPIGRYSLVLVIGTLVLFSVYFYQGTRFMAGPATVLMVLGAVALADGGGWLWARARQHSAFGAPKMEPQRTSSNLTVDTSTKLPSTPGPFPSGSHR